MVQSYHTRSGPAPWVLGYEGREIPSPLQAAIRRGLISGLILFRDNLGNSVEEALELRSKIQSLVPSGEPFLILMDEEGGLIHPTAGMILPSGERLSALPTPQALGRIDKVADVRWVGQILGERLRYLGAHVDLAPSLDLDTHPENGVIGTRSFGIDPDRAATLGWAFARGLLATRTGACLKHYPGHGGTTKDSHKSLPVMESKHRSMHERPFVDCVGREASDRPWVMSAHVDWGDGLPVSLSRAVISRLSRKSPKSLVITDSLDMGAVSLKDGAAEEALLAHNDLLLVARDWKSGLNSVASLDAQVGTNPAMLAAMVRARSRIRETWSTYARRRRGPGSDCVEITGRKERSDIVKKIGALHRASIRFSGHPDKLPKGGWVWIVPEGLPPYCELRNWMPPKGRKRFCEEIVWVPSEGPAERVDGLLRELKRDKRPKMLVTLFRGLPTKRNREAWGQLIGSPGIEVVAHLLDSFWPDAEETARFCGWKPDKKAKKGAKRVAGGDSSESLPGPLMALGSSPHEEGLTALAEALDLPKKAWAEDEDGIYFPVDK